MIIISTVTWMAKKYHYLRTMARADVCCNVYVKVVNADLIRGVKKMICLHTIIINHGPTASTPTATAVIIIFVVHTTHTECQKPKMIAKVALLHLGVEQSIIVKRNIIVKMQIMCTSSTITTKIVVEVVITIKCIFHLTRMSMSKSTISNCHNRWVEVIFITMHMVLLVTIIIIITTID